MGPITIGLLMISGASVVLGSIGLGSWLSERKRIENLVVTIVCIALSVYALIEVQLATTTNPEAYASLLRWSHIPSGVAIIGVATFVRLRLAGRVWLFWPCVGLRLLTLVLNFFVFTPGINFHAVTSIGRVNLFGETLSYPIGIVNPWMAVSHSAHLLLIILCVDASVRAWWRGNHRAAIVFGTSTALFSITSLVFAIGALWGFFAFPLLATPSILFLVVGMLVELNVQMKRGAKLSARIGEQDGELSERLEQLNLSANAASVGLWRRNMETGEFWTSEKLKEIYGFPPDREMSVDALNGRIHPADRERVKAARRDVELRGGEYQIEYRIVLPDGKERWIFTSGRADDPTAGALPKMKRGAAVDITPRKAAETAVYELSGKLINAQEEERGRIARELHDDLSQRIALTSILLEQIRGGNEVSAFVRTKIGDIIEGVMTLATDMHRLTHELHPAKINQLGLASALRSYCVDIQAAYPITIKFEAQGVPAHLPDDISLCFYRVAQESLQNVVRHSDARTANVDLVLTEGDLRLTISDDGRGFDGQRVREKDSLGLVSIDERMRSIYGEAVIDSALGSGTRIEARVRLNGNGNGNGGET
jgi:signal transduction histidine kinase